MSRTYGDGFQNSVSSLYYCPRLRCQKFSLILAAAVVMVMAIRCRHNPCHVLAPTPRPPPHVFHEFNALTYDVTLCIIPLHVNETANCEYGLFGTYCRTNNQLLDQVA